MDGGGDSLNLRDGDHHRVCFKLCASFDNGPIFGDCLALRLYDRPRFVLNLSGELKGIKIIADDVDEYVPRPKQRW